MPKPNSRQLRKLRNDPALMADLGYRRVSNSQNVVARIDVPDWQKTMLLLEPMVLMTEDAADYYRRNVSDDRIKLDQSIYKQMPGSTGDTTGFIDEEGNDVKCQVVLLEHDERVVKVSELQGTSVQEPAQKPTLSQKFRSWLANQGLISR